MRPTSKPLSTRSSRLTNIGKPTFAAAILLAIAGCSATATPSVDAGTTSEFSEGSPLPEVSLVGYIDRNHDGKLTADEHGAFTPKDVVAANPGVELLLVHVAFGWCKYCWSETPEQIKWTTGYGGRFLSIQILVEDRVGNAATKSFVDEWIDLHQSSLPTALEPSATLFNRFGRSATYLLVDPKNNMKILTVGAGPPTFDFVRTKITERLGPLP